MRAHKSLLAWIVTLLLVFSAMPACPNTASAQNGGIEQAFELGKSAMDDYDFFELESADNKLMQATQIVETLGINDPKISAIYIAQGVVSYGRFKDSAKVIAEERAFAAFLKALTFNPDAAIPNDYKSSELETIMERARETLANTPKASIAAMAGVKPSVEHTAVITSPRCAGIEITANVPTHPDVYRVKVYYSSDDDRGFDSIEMHPSPSGPDALTAVIPGIAAQGSRVRYFIEATDRNNTVVAGVADQAHPLNTMLSGECTGFSDDEIAEQYGDPIFQMSLLIGTGMGIISGKTYTANKSLASNSNEQNAQYTNEVNLGVAIMPLHLRGTFMFNLPHGFQLGAYIRGQLVNIVGESNLSETEKKDKEKGKVVGNLMVGAAVRYMPISKQPYRLYTGLEVGWGGANATVSTEDDFKAIFLIKGPIHVAPEIGFLWSFHRNVGLDVQLVVPIHFPDKFNVHFDLSAGIFFQF